MITVEDIEREFEYKDGHLYWKITHPQSKKKPGDLAGYKQKQGYRAIHWRGTLYKEHRMVFLLFHGYWPTTVDHINGVKDDNRIENLREADSRQQANNRKLPCTSKCGFKGVYWNQREGKYRAHITHKGKRIHLGYFTDLMEAALAYDYAAMKYHGKFARLNINDYAWKELERQYA